MDSSQRDSSLLVKRFHDLTVEDFGQRIQDFSCARTVGSGIYGGRLFVTEKTLVFVSAYSNSKSYDCCVPLGDITMATAFHRSIIPTLEIDWGKSRESFTNFYDLKAVETTLNKILPSGKIAVRQTELYRMSSMPVKRPFFASTSAVITPKLQPCPFFSKCGFCPRRIVCRLDHTLQTKPSSDSSSTSSETIPKGANIGSKPWTFQRSPLKKPHIQENTTGNAESEPETTTALPTLRSLSSPAAISVPPKTKQIAQNGIEMPNGSHSNASHGEPSSKESDSRTDSIPKLEARHSDKEIHTNLPASFDFSSQLSEQTAMSTASDEFHTPEGDFEGAKSDVPTDDKESVFVFSAPSPSLQSKRKDALVEVAGALLPSAASSVPKEVNEDVSRQVAMLTQQLELGSDDDSLHGDLDIEAQLRIMDAFTQDSPEIPEAPPPYSSVVPHPLSASLASRLSLPGEDPPTKETEEGRAHKRQPCFYFLSGYCRNGTECPNYHGMDPDVEELEYGDIDLVPIPPKIKVHSGVALGRGDINSGDKIILPPSILLSCEQQQFSYPMAFKMENTLSNKVVYGGVLQFTSPAPDSAYLPQWMMDHLLVRDGDTVAFSHVDLPKGKFVQLQPVSSSWLAIPYDKRMAVMEFQLRNFQTLTEGTKVTLTYELNKYTLKVLQCKPAQGISIVDADLTTDIIEPADMQRFYSVEEGQAENIALDEPKSCDVDANAYRHFVLLSLPGKHLPSKLRVEVESTEGDADLFLSQSFATPTQSRYTWCNQDLGKSVISLTAQDEKNYDIRKPLYAGVMATFDPAKFTIAVQNEELAQNTSKAGTVASTSPSLSGQTLRGIASSAEATPPESEPLPPGHQRCSYCGSVMASLRLLMHERHCSQSTFKCPLCKVCVPKSAERKHKSISHELLVCECGEEHTQLALHRHQEFDCTKRMLSCPFKWCNLCFPMDQLGNHEHLCGRKKVYCPVCNEEVSQLEMEIHLEAFHGVLTESIDWAKPLTGQVLAFKPSEPKFKCSCGQGFEFQDDMQVHQLTECTFTGISEVEGGMGVVTDDPADAAAEFDLVG